MASSIVHKLETVEPRYPFVRAKPKKTLGVKYNAVNRYTREAFDGAINPNRQPFRSKNAGEGSQS